MDRIRQVILLLSACALGFVAGCARREPGLGNIAGVVTDKLSAPLTNVPVVIVASSSTEPYPATAPLTDSKGRFDFANLPVAEYTLKVSTGTSEAEGKVAVTAGKTSTLDLKLK